MEKELRKILRKSLFKLKIKYNKLDDINCENVLDIKKHLELVINLNYLRGKIRGYEEIFTLISEHNSKKENKEVSNSSHA